MSLTQKQSEEAIVLLEKIPPMISVALTNCLPIVYKTLYCIDINLKISKLLEELKNNKTTNGDKWRSMSDEKIATVICRDGCCVCPLSQKECDTYSSEEQCIKKIMRWLKQEAFND